MRFAASRGCKSGCNGYMNAHVLLQNDAKTHYNGCMNVAWDLGWGGHETLCFSCKVAAAGDEG
jgi:hypothetical protein